MTPAEETRSSPRQLQLRPAEKSDVKALWEWRNEEETRRQSFHTEIIPYAEHERWFFRRLESPDSPILIISDGEKDIGQVRFDINRDGTAEVNIGLDAAARHQGYGTGALKLACRQVVAKNKVTRVIAHIKEGNTASIKAFTDAGFTNKGLVAYQGNRVIEMTWNGKTAQKALR